VTFRWHWAPGQVASNGGWQWQWTSSDGHYRAVLGCRIVSGIGASDGLDGARIVQGVEPDEAGGPQGWFSDRFARKVSAPVLEVVLAARPNLILRWDLAVFGPPVGRWGGKF
jgi:hypothetical protein